MESSITLVLAIISGVLLVYNFILGRKVNSQRRQKIKELDKEIKGKKDETRNEINNLNDLLREYRNRRRK